MEPRTRVTFYSYWKPWHKYTIIPIFLEFSTLYYGWEVTVILMNFEIVVRHSRRGKKEK
jgi:hypothetical protein